MIEGVRKTGNGNTAAAATDVVLYTVSPGMAALQALGPPGRQFTTDMVVITVAGATNITIWDGPSLTGVIQFGPMIIAGANEFILPIALQFRTSVVFQTSGAINSTVTISGLEK